jgi:hypothetical protein
MITESRVSELSLNFWDQGLLREMVKVEEGTFRCFMAGFGQFELLIGCKPKLNYNSKIFDEIGVVTRMH